MFQKMPQRRAGVAQHHADVAHQHAHAQVVGRAPGQHFLGELLRGFGITAVNQAQ